MNLSRKLAILVLGLVFLASAIVKGLDATDLAAQVSYLGITREPWLAHLIAAGVIGLEALLGAALILRLELKSVTLPLAGAVLIFFTGVMGWAWMFRDIQNCGCFGRYLPMTPAEAMLKNLLLLGLGAYAWGEPDHAGITAWLVEARLAWRVILAGLGALAAVGLVAVQAPYSRGMAPVGGGPMSGGPAYSADRPLAGYSFLEQGRVKYDLGRGTYLVAMLSESCSHCAEEVASLNLLVSDGALPPVVALVLGEEEDVRGFGQRYHPAFPTQPTPVLEFLKLIGDAPPRYILARDGRQLAVWDEHAPTREAILAALEPPGPQAGP